jgi:hypothetical protein
MIEKDEYCNTACNHLRHLVKTGFYGVYTVKMKDGIIYHAIEERSLKFGGTEKERNGNDIKKD